MQLSRFFAAALVALGAVAAPARANADEPASPPTANASGDPNAGAPTAQSCGAAYERAQTEKLAGHYVSAAAAALECSQVSCNPAIVRECMRFYESLQEDTPTLVFSARKAEGGELVDVRVEIDGKPAVDQLTGRPFAIDPGPHDFVFIDAERGKMKVSETARVGDHARVIEVTFADPHAKPAPLTPVAPPPAPATETKRGVPVATWVLGGVGVASAGAFAFLRLSAVHKYNDYNSTCSPRCDPSDVDHLRTQFTASYIALGVSAASLTGAALVYVLAPRQSRKHEVEASVSPRGDGAMFDLRAQF